jgi:DNA-binding NarL/FixJ family response regulator
VTTRILLVDDNEMIRDGLRSLIQARADMDLVGEASDGRQAAQLQRELSPDVIIMDVSMPGMNGIEATRHILADNPAAKVLILTLHSDSSFMAAALRAGARGYLLKEDAFDELAGAVRAVASGGIWVSRVSEIPPGRPAGQASPAAVSRAAASALRSLADMADQAVADRFAGTAPTQEDWASARRGADKADERPSEVRI